jgi:hypothetical protein
MGLLDNVLDRLDLWQMKRRRTRLNREWGIAVQNKDRKAVYRTSHDIRELNYQIRQLEDK